MKEKLLARLDGLLKEGYDLRGSIHSLDSIWPRTHIVQHYVSNPEPDQEELKRQWLQNEIDRSAGSWMPSCISLVSKLVAPTSHHAQMNSKLGDQNPASSRVSSGAILSMLGLLESIKKESECGLLEEPEFIFAAKEFEGFLLQAEDLFRDSRIYPAAILASVVMEHAVRKVAKKHGIEIPVQAGLTKLVETLTKQGIFSDVLGDQLKSCAKIRNHALHGEEQKFEGNREEVRFLIEKTKSLVENNL